MRSCFLVLIRAEARKSRVVQRNESRRNRLLPALFQVFREVHERLLIILFRFRFADTEVLLMHVAIGLPMDGLVAYPDAHFELLLLEVQ